MLTESAMCTHIHTHIRYVHIVGERKMEINAHTSIFLVALALLRWDWIGFIHKMVLALLLRPMDVCVCVMECAQMGWYTYTISYHTVSDRVSTLMLQRSLLFAIPCGWHDATTYCWTYNVVYVFAYGVRGMTGCCFAGTKKIDFHISTDELRRFAHTNTLIWPSGWAWVLLCGCGRE